MKVLNLKGLLIITVFLLSVQLIGGMVISPLIGSAVVQGLNKAAGTRISAGTIRLWPLTLSFGIRDLRVFDPDNEDIRIARIEKASFRISPLRLLSKRLVLSRVTLSGAQIDLKGEPDGSFNIQRLARGERSVEQAARRKGIFDQLKGKQDWFGRIYSIIKDRTSREALEEKKEEQKRSRQIKRQVRELPKGRRVKFTTPSDEFLFQVKDLQIIRSTVNIVTKDKENVSVNNANIHIRDLGIDPLRGARFDRLRFSGEVGTKGGSAGSFSFDFNQYFRHGTQSIRCDLSAKDIDLSAVKFLYAESLPVNFIKGRITLDSKTEILDSSLRSKNSFTIRDHNIVPGPGSKFYGGVVPLTSICDALNNVDPIEMRFSVTGTVDSPEFQGFHDSLMSLVKAHLDDIGSRIKDSGIRALTGLISGDAGAEGEGDGSGTNAFNTLKGLFGRED